METVAPLRLRALFVCAVPVAPFINFVVPSKQGAHSVSVSGAINGSIVRAALGFALSALF